jgi:hypothetical protein
MFLIDYDGRIGNLDGLFSESLDSTVPYVPIKSPRLTQFSDDNLIDWIDTQCNSLPIELTHQVDNVVQEILNNSEDGIPEYVLAEICARCGYNWYEVMDQWLRA